jgi:alpha 1,6-mannosyltransferase
MGFQVAEFTFAAQAGHPVYLDVLRHVQQMTRHVNSVRRGRGSESDGEDLAGDSDEFVFYWKGPTVWSQSVWRYLRARWGFDVARLTDVDHPVRVGDVLILPYASFQADYSESWAQQSNKFMVWHGAHHRWMHKDENKDEQKEKLK